MVMSWFMAILATLIFAAALLFVEKRIVTGGLETKAAVSASFIGSTCQKAIWGRDVARLSGFLIPLVDQDPDIEYIGVTWKQGGQTAIFARMDEGAKIEGVVHDDLRGVWWPEPRDERVGRVRWNAVTSKKGLHYSAPFEHRENDSGWIHLGLSLDAYDANVASVYQTTGIVAALSLAISGIISFFFAKSFTAPIRELQTYAQRVTAGALTARANIRTNDEIQDLADSLNKMVTALQESQTRVRDNASHKAALREKEILLREIHHRVKNNMQILTSLLRLQSRRAGSEEMRNVLQESEARIRSMGLLHENLYKSESISRIVIAEYLKTLTSELVRVNTPPGVKREIRLAAVGIEMGLDTALPCGLIVTELVSNALKYAFDRNTDGAIVVSVSKPEPGQYSLLVWDNGCGIPKGFDIKTSESLGMRLVTMLTEQLNGELLVTSERGTRIEIRFKETKYTKRL
jgi:two-component sensor histidine kinase/HAMP domain-containing protein